MQASVVTEAVRAKPVRRLHGWWMPIAFLLPSLVSFALFKYYPLFKLFYMSFFAYQVANPPGDFVGFHNYSEFLGTDSFMLALRNTFVFALLFLAMTFWVPIVQALLLGEIGRGNSTFRFLYQIPSIVPYVVTVLVWKWMYNPDFGLLNYYLGKLGLGPYLWLNNIHMTKFAIVLPSLVATQGISVLLYYSAIRGIPQDMLEAAKVDGAGPWKRITALLLPNMRFIIFIQFVGFLTGALLIFDPIYVMTQGGPAESTTTVSLHIYNTAFYQYRFGVSAAISVVMFAITGLITYAQLRLSKGTDG